jgi:hypothetical protein
MKNTKVTKYIEDLSDLLMGYTDDFSVELRDEFVQVLEDAIGMIKTGVYDEEKADFAVEHIDD